VASNQSTMTDNFNPQELVKMDTNLVNLLSLQFEKHKNAELQELKELQKKNSRPRGCIKSLKKQIQKITDEMALTDIKLAEMNYKIKDLEFYYRPIATQAKKNHYFLLMTQFIKSFLYCLRLSIFNDGYYDEHNLDTFDKIRNYPKTPTQLETFNKITKDLNTDTVESTFKEIINKRIGITHPDVLDILLSTLSDDGTVTPDILTKIVAELYHSNQSKKIREEYDKIIQSADLLSRSLDVTLIFSTR